MCGATGVRDSPCHTVPQTLRVWGRGCAPPQKIFDFLCGNNAFWCTFDVDISPTSKKNSELFFTCTTVVLSDITVLQQDTQTSSVAVENSAAVC